MFKHLKISRLGLLLRIWGLERTKAILADQYVRICADIRGTDGELNHLYSSLRKSLPPETMQIPLETVS